MGGQHSKEASLHQQVVNGNIEGVKALHREGANLEWFDNEGKTALIVACMQPQLYHVAKTLLDLGANINAFRTGNNGGTALHHAVKRGLENTVKLLLSHGANALAVNDDGQTALDAARVKGFSSIVRTIESHICYFSGWLRELYGPGFLEALIPQLLSREIWIVVVPCGSRNRRKPLKLQLAMYATLQDAQPRTTITLWKAKIKEPIYHQQVPVLSIFDKGTRTRYKLTYSNEGDKQQLQWLCNACRGIPQVTHPNLLLDSHIPAVPQGAPPTSAEDVELAMAINASLLSAMEERPPINDSNLGAGDRNPNGWGASSHNGWALTEGPAPSQASSNGWLDKPPVDAFNGWGTPETGAASSPPTRAPPVIPETTSNSSANSTNTHSHNGWGPVGGSESSSKGSSSGWLERPAEVAHSGWVAGEAGSSSSLVESNNIHVVPTTHMVAETAERPIIGMGPETASVPSAPAALFESADYGPIQYPSIDSSPVNLTTPSVEDSVTKKSPVKVDVETSSSCVVCLDAPVEGACVPCGHMAGCMSCLNDIKAKKWGCPVCRSKIDRVIRLFAV